MVAGRLESRPGEIVEEAWVTLSHSSINQIGRKEERKGTNNVED
jgi:hypothetical protein